MKTLFATQKQSFIKYLFFTDFRGLLDRGGSRRITPEEKETIFLKSLRNKLQSFLEKKTADLALEISNKVFAILNKKSSEEIVRIIPKIILGKDAGTLFQFLSPNIQEICKERNEDFIIDLVTEIIKCLTTNDCKKFLPSEIQKLFDSEILTEIAITGMGETSDGYFKIADKYLLEKNHNGDIIGFKFDEKDKIAIAIISCQDINF
jgi:hypothetical protein